ncbi:MAG: hypothetical protein ACRDMU_09595 [Gaiellaceae bacterium]
MQLLSLLKGLPGHPLHPPMTDGAIGSYTAATGMRVLGLSEPAASAIAPGEKEQL